MTCWPPTACKGRVRTEACGLSPFHHVALRDSPQLLPRTLGVVSGLTDAVAMSLRLFLNTGSLSAFCEGKTQVVIKLPLMPQPEVMFCILRGHESYLWASYCKPGPVQLHRKPCRCRTAHSTAPPSSGKNSPDSPTGVLWPLQVLSGVQPRSASSNMESLI